MTQVTKKVEWDFILFHIERYPNFLFTKRVTKKTLGNFFTFIDKGDRYEFFQVFFWGVPPGADAAAGHAAVRYLESEGFSFGESLVFILVVIGIIGGLMSFFGDNDKK